MNIGSKLYELRKSKNFSQEDLAEKIGVTRQTISKWELGETYPDINQVKVISKLFNISIDELVDNNIKEILVEKATNTEKLAGIVYKILKVLCIIAGLFLLLFVCAFVLFTFVRKQPEDLQVKQFSLNCTLNDSTYHIIVGSDNYFKCDNCAEKMVVYFEDITDWANMKTSKENIYNYFINNGGSCIEE